MDLIKPKLFYKLLIIIGAGILVVLAALLGWHNYSAAARLHTAQRQDKTQNYDQAQRTLSSINQNLLLPNLVTQIKHEQTHNAHLRDDYQKLQRVKQLLQENKPQEALNLLETLQTADTKSTQTTQTLQQQAVKQGATPTPSPTPKPGGSHPPTPTPTPAPGPTPTPTPTPTPAPGPTPTPTPTPPPPGPMSAISVTAFSATASPYNATFCHIAESVSFSTNGSGNVNVVWKMLSTKTSSAIDNPVVYGFSAAGSKTDGQSFTAQGLESGDSYRISVTITSQSNGAVTTTGGPVTISSCAAPQGLHSPQQPSTMTVITPGSVGISQSQDGIFVNECSMVLSIPFSVNASGSVEAIYTITSGSSGGATLYATTTKDFTGSGSDTDTSYIRMPHLNGGDIYSISVKLIDVGAPSVFATSGPVTTGCS